MRVAVALLAAILVLVTGTGATAAKTTLRLTMQLPMTSVLGRNVMMFKQAVEKASGGTVEVQIFDSGQLFHDKDVPQAVGQGQVDLGVVSLARYGGEIPAVDVFHIPFLFDTDAKRRLAAEPGSAVRGPLDDAIAGTGARVLCWQAYGSTVLLGRGGDIVKSPADLKGKRVRVFGRLLGLWVIANGGTPVNIASADHVAAYQKGTIDIGMTGPATIKQQKIWEVMDTVTVVNLASMEFLLVINEKAFQRLTEAERLVIIGAARAAEIALRQEFSEREKQGLEAGAQNKMTVHVPGIQEIEAFRRSAATVDAEFLKSSGALGKRVLDAALGLH